jgi:serine/threonine protein kinase
MSVARHFRRAGPAAPNTAAPNTATYETGAQVGSGGSSIVRRDAATPEFCTKVVRDPTLLAACVCEITLAMALSPHPNIIGFTGVEYADDYICIRMPWYGESLRTAIVRQRAGESQRAAAAIRGVMRGLRYMHSRGVVHCDIKPENIYVSDAGEGVIADFGSAMLAGSPPVYYELQTVLYRAPETVPGRPPAPAIDMWSLGVILAELGGYVHSVTAAKVHADTSRT